MLANPPEEKTLFSDLLFPVPWDAEGYWLPPRKSNLALKRQPPSWKWKYSDHSLIGQSTIANQTRVSLILMIFQISDYKVPFVKQVSGHWKARKSAMGRNHSSNKWDEPFILTKMKRKKKKTIQKTLNSSATWCVSHFHAKGNYIKTA